MDIKNGETLMLLPFVLCDSAGRQRFDPVPGTVVYINEPHRYFTAEFKVPSGGHFRESFKFDEVEGEKC